MTTITLNEQRASFLLSAIVDSSDDAIISKDLSGVITSWNKSAERMFGYTAEEAVGRSVAELLIPEDRQEEELDILARLRAGERVDHFETVRQRKDGTLLEISLTISPVRDAAGNIIGASKIAREIGERKRAERSGLLLSAIVDSSDDAIISKNLHGVITSWNQSAERLFGYTAEEAIGKTVAELLIPDDRQDEEPNILARLKTGERVEHFETVRRCKSGKLLEISLTISPVKDMRGNIVGASKIVRDITEAKRVRMDLVESERRFRQLADSMPQMVWAALPDGRVDYYNERWYDFSGSSGDPLSDSGWRSLTHPQDVRTSLDAYETAIRTAQPFNTELRLWDRREERWRWFVARALPAHDGMGQIARWFGTFTDIDQHKRVENELRRANEGLEQFAFSASHDLQEPLRAIKIYSQLLAKRHSDKLDPQALDYMRYLQHGATRMEYLVRDLLAYTEALKSEPSSVEITDANEALRTTLANLSGAILQSGAQIIADRLPSLPIRRTHLQQLLQNLVGNAIKYRTPGEPPKIHVMVERQSEDWICAVSDNGIGIDPQYKEHIFGLFKRLHTNDEYPGTGIGLAICHRIVEQYRGRIWVDSSPGQGSTFRFSLPA